MLNRFNKAIHLISSWFEWVGIAALLTIMSVTCIDVIGAKLFLKPVFGAIDIVMLSQAVAISFGAAMSFILGRHVQVEFFVMRMPRRAQAGIDSLVHFLGLFFFGLVVWRLCVHGYSFQAGGEASATAYIPFYPFAYGIALAIVPLCIVLLLRLIESLARMVQQ
jgi:TRAP-type C4-dicarboxylate transport system permease small subunit